MIPFIDLASQYMRIQDDIEAGVLQVLRSGKFIQGPEVERLEQQLARYVGTQHAVTCASGTDALIIALLAKGVGRGDAVLTTPFTFVASAEAIALIGATPLFVDVDPVTFNLSTAALRTAVDEFRRSEKTKSTLNLRGVVAVDLFGLPADYDAIEEVAREQDLFVIEDAAQSFGARSGNRMAGALSHIGCTSFFPAKPLGCYGDGGAIFTDDDELAALFRSIRVHGQGADRYEHVRLGLTGRLDTLQAVILMTKLAIFEDELAARQIVADAYSRFIRDARLALDTPTIPQGAFSSWAQYSVLAQDSVAREVFRSKLHTKGFPTAVHYPRPLHLQPAFESLGYRRGDFPIAESLSDRIFSLPMHPYLSIAEVEEIVATMAA